MSAETLGTPVEIWLDLESGEGANREVICTLFARQVFAVRPLMGETLSLHAAKESAEPFNVVMAWGPMVSHNITTEIEEISHYRGPTLEDAAFHTSLRCRAVHLASRQDVEAVARFLVAAHGFEIDPYGVNKIPEGGGVA
ncbi:MAG: hypothetical protein K8R60_19360 [Burkholderiales bacterium]|nr:hypothetical protein [Burkholderiales bacterium]